MKVRVPRAAGALAAQMTQALGSFVIQVLAARELGAAGFGVFAFLFGAMIMATALSTGLIGDSLTVLDRHDPSVRAALWRLGWLVVVVASLGGLATGYVFGGLGLGTSVVFAGAVATFMAADLLRRMLMANLRFWSLVLVDGVAVVVALGFLGLLHAQGPLGLHHFLMATVVGQLTACAVALTRLPAPERWRARGSWGAWRAVLGFGAWRATQQFVRPTMLTLARWVVLLAAGQAAVGELEAARVYVAPAMLLVQGVGSYLFSTFAAERALGPTRLLVRADRAAVVMLVGALVVGAAASAALPIAGDLLTGGRFDLSLLAIVGWACYAASCAAVLPYGSLAAVGGRQRWVLGLRVLDSLFSLTVAASAVLLLGASTDWVPWLLSVGSFAGGLLCRQLILVPLRRSAGITSREHRPAEVVTP